MLVTSLLLAFGMNVHIPPPPPPKVAQGQRQAGEAEPED